MVSAILGKLLASPKSIASATGELDEVQLEMYVKLVVEGAETHRRFTAIHRQNYGSASGGFTR